MYTLMLALTTLMLYVMCMAYNEQPAVTYTAVCIDQLAKTTSDALNTLTSMSAIS